ncbi:MAG: histidine phosphatase family protein [Clostridia bacterium]|jgi:alpha-ribazole phosphatase|nr:histidine phosphatase family protein [Clostridia bacterium]
MIYVIRHGQTQANEKKQYLGSGESPLSSLGISQHDELVKQLDGVILDSVISSPRERCRALAQVICNTRALEVNVNNRIAEFNFGVFESLTYEQAQKRYPDEWAKWVQNDSAYTLPKGESIDSFEERVKAFSWELKQIDESKNIAVITHGGVITSLLCYLLVLEISNKWRFRVENGSLIKINVTDGFHYLEL